jgi:uncharacterized protein (TIGR03083 family)
MDLNTLTDKDRVALLQQALSSVEELCAQLEQSDWDLPTDLPGWSVKDNLSHLVSYESAAIGRPHAPAELDVSKYGYLTDPFQVANEREVELRRGRSGAEVLAEYREVIEDRVASLASLDQSGTVAPNETPLGLTLPWRTFLPIRISDVFYHEQDMRRATGKPGHLSGDVARMVFERVGRTAMARVIAKEASLPEGTVVAFDVGPPAEPFGVAVREGRGVLIEAPADAHVRLGGDFEAFLLLVGGRWSAQRLQDEGRLKIEGDPEVARTLLEKVVVVP